VPAVLPTPTLPSLRLALSRSCRGACLILAAALAWSGASAATLEPELTLEARYDDNVGATRHGAGDLVRVVAPGLAAAGTGRAVEWRASALRRVISYTNSGSPPTATYDAASLRAGYTAKTRSYLRLYSDFRRSRNGLEPDDRNVLVPGKYRSGVGTAILHVSHLEASARVGAWDYSRPDQFDATAKRLDATLLPVRSRVHEWLLSYRGQELSVSGRRALTTHAALAGFRRRHSARLGSRWEAGVVEIDDHDGSPRKRRAAFTAGVTLYQQGNDETAAEARVERDAITAVAIEARRRIGDGLVSVTWRRRLDATGGYDPTPVRNERVSLALADTLGRSTVVSLEGSYDWTRAYRVVGSRSDTFRAGVNLSRPVHRWITARLGYDFVRQTSRDRPDPLAFRRNRIIMGLTAALR
jgi:hypothetical protein